VILLTGTRQKYWVDNELRGCRFTITIRSERQPPAELSSIYRPRTVCENEPTPTIRYQLHRLACPRCRIRTCGILPPGIPSGAFGPRLRAVLSVLAGAYRLGKQPIQQLVFDLRGLSISPGMISRLERQRAAELEAPARSYAGMFVTPPRLTSTRRRGGRGVPRPGFLGGRDRPGDGLHDRSISGGRGRQSHAGDDGRQGGHQ
jgi:hypothetical protein